MLVDYTTILNRPSVSVEGPTQQGVESVVKVTPASDVASDGSIHPSGSCSSESSVLWLELPPSSSYPSLSGSHPAVGMPYGGAGGISGWGVGEGCLPNSTSCWGEGEESCCSCSWRRCSRSSCRRRCSLSRWLDWHVTMAQWALRKTRGKKGITDLRAMHLIRAIYKTHRKHKTESRTIWPASKPKVKWDNFFVRRVYR
jgi:hypothetical protein